MIGLAAYEGLMAGTVSLLAEVPVEDALGAVSATKRLSDEVSERTAAEWVVRAYEHAKRQP